VSVRDTGIGIPPDQIGSVFEMFTQVDRSSRRSQGGLGIGLTLVRRLVTMHGGRVEARSEGVNAGSEFIVELPIASAPPHDVSVPEGVERLPPRRILLVDDNADAAVTLSSLLDTLGATVRVAHNGPEALSAFDVFHPDAVLLDIGMPDMDGYEVARRLRAADHNGVLLIALTGWGQEHDQERARAAGFDHHMIKPPNLEMLRAVLCEGWNESMIGDQ
jgi:CheY-like chemotaxis protein